jgi:hypothetical protein
MGQFVLADEAKHLDRRARVVEDRMDNDQVMARTHEIEVNARKRA